MKILSSLVCANKFSVGDVGISHEKAEKTCVRVNESGRRRFFLLRLSSAKKDE